MNKIKVAQANGDREAGGRGGRRRSEGARNRQVLLRGSLSQT